MSQPHRHVWVYSIHGVYCKICGISKERYDRILRELEEGGVNG